MAAASRAPEGTIAMLFTDIEGSTRLATELKAAWPAVLEAHHGIVGGAITDQGGFVEGTEGDSFFATFSDASAAARAAVTALRGLRLHAWPAAVQEPKVRMGLHVGHVERSTTGYVGLEVHRAARVAAAAHGGQLLLTAPARALIGDELDTEPLGEHRLKDFPGPELLFCAVVDGRGASAFPPPRTQPVRPTNLPAGTPPLVGREADIDRIRDALLTDGDRLVTLTGRGGAGKTSLALVAGSGMLDEHPGGVWLARLATLTSPDDVLPAVAAAVGAEGSLERTPMEAIASRLAGRGASLLILDNLEHLLAAAPSIAGLLDAIGDCRLLVTSQAPLRLDSERCLSVDALDDGAALALIERVAQRRSAALKFAHDDRAPLVEIVAMLDGLPLALELAAARLTLLTPAQLRDRLRSSSAVLRDDRRDRADRHRSLRATVEWTLGLLPEPARQLFIRMGVFAGPIELDDLETVTGADGLDVLEALSALLDVALVRRVEAGDGRVRLGLPEALRQIAAALLDDAADVERWRGEHLKWQYELLWSARHFMLRRARYRTAIAYEAEAGLALEWARRTGDERAAAVAAVRGSIFASTGRLREAASLLGEVLGSAPGDSEIRAQAQTAYGSLISTLGRLDDGFAATDAAVRLAVEPATRAVTLIQRGIQHLRVSRPAKAVADHKEATAIAEGLGAEEFARALGWESQARMDDGQLDVAAGLLAEARGIAGGIDGVDLWNLYTLDADLAALSGHPAEAMVHYARSLEAAERHGARLQIWWDLTGLSDALAANGNDADAVEVAGIGEAHIADLGDTGTPLMWHLQDRDYVAEAAERLGPAAADEHRARGRAVDAGYRVTRACAIARAQHAVAT